MDANGGTEDANGGTEDANGGTEDANGGTGDANGGTGDANGGTEDANGGTEDANGGTGDANGGTEARCHSIYRVFDGGHECPLSLHSPPQRDHVGLTKKRQMPPRSAEFIPQQVANAPSPSFPPESSTRRPGDRPKRLSLFVMPPAPERLRNEFRAPRKSPISRNAPCLLRAWKKPAGFWKYLPRFLRNHDTSSPLGITRARA